MEWLDQLHEYLYYVENISDASLKHMFYIGPLG